MSSSKASINSAHDPGHTSVTFSRDGKFIYTGGSDGVARAWNAKLGPEEEPISVLEATQAITSIAAGDTFWISGSKDSQVRKYGGEPTGFTGLVTEVAGVAVYCVAVDPKAARVAVTSEEPRVKLVNIDKNTAVLLEGHTKAVRRATWHPAGDLLTSCGADGKIIVWDVSSSDPKIVQTIDGVIPAIADTESPEFLHDCSVIWHPSGQYFFVATRTHEIVTISRSDWKKSATFADPAASGAVTAMAVSVNGVYLATASKSGLCIWSTQNRRMLYKFQGALGAPITQLAWSPDANLLVWTDTDGVLNRWADPIPPDAISSFKEIAAPAAAPLPPPKKRAATPTLFDDAEEEVQSSQRKDVEKALDGVDDKDEDLDGIDLDDDMENWVVDDLGGGLNDEGEEKRWAGASGVREMVSVTKAQPAFQPGATPMDNKKRYLAYNMIGVIEATDQDTHQVINVEFHDRSARKGYHFTNAFKYDLAALGERGAVYACPPEDGHPAHVLYKPYGGWQSQSEWTYDLPKGTRVIGVAAGGAPPTKSFRERSDVDIQGNGNVVIATSEHELIFLTGSGVERYVMSMQGDFVTMVAGPEWVFIVERDGATTMDGSQNLTGRLIKFEDYCLLQRDTLPVRKGQTLKWVGVTEEGAPVLYDSSGVLHALPRFRLPFSATWTRILDANTLERREGKDESYWPVGVSGETFMCLILKGRQEHPGFPRPLIQELPLRLPFKRVYKAGDPSEEHLARENMALDILRDALGEELTSPDISRRELDLDKEIIQLIQSACKTDQLARAVDLAKLLHHTASFDMAIKLAGFYHLIGLQEKFEALKDDRLDDDRLESARERRRERAGDFEAVPPPHQYTSVAGPSRPKPFQDFAPPPAIARPGLQRAAPAPAYRPPEGTNRDLSVRPLGLQEDDLQSRGATDWDEVTAPGTPKRKRSGDEVGPEAESEAKRRATEEHTMGRGTADRAKTNPFARKNPFAKSAEGNKESQRAGGFFSKTEAEKGKKPALGKAKTKGAEKLTAKQTTLQFGKRMNKSRSNGESQNMSTDDTTDTQETEHVMVAATQIEEEPTQTPPPDDDPIVEDQEMDDGEESIPWPASPGRDTSVLDAE